MGQALLAVKWVLEMIPGLLHTDLPSWSSLSSQSEPRDTGKQDHFKPHGDAEREEALEGHTKEGISGTQQPCVNMTLVPHSISGLASAVLGASWSWAAARASAALQE